MLYYHIIIILITIIALYLTVKRYNKYETIKFNDTITYARIKRKALL